MIRLLSKFAIIAALSSILFAGAAQADQRTVRLKVPGMFCATCPFVVSKSLRRVAGVVSVKTSLADKTATVVFDDARTSVDALTSATKNAGYPSHVEK